MNDVGKVQSIIELLDRLSERLGIPTLFAASFLYIIYLQIFVVAANQRIIIANQMRIARITCQHDRAFRAAGNPGDPVDCDNLLKQQEEQGK